MTATLTCFPLDVVRTRLLAKGSGPRYGGPFQTISGIARHEGVSALYTGEESEFDMGRYGGWFFKVTRRFFKFKASEPLIYDPSVFVPNAGCLPALIGMAPAGAVFYGLFDLLKRRHLDELTTVALMSGGPRPTHLDPQWTLLYGAVAGVASEVIVYPVGS